MFVTMGGIDKAGHMWGAQDDAATFTGSCSVGTPEAVGAAQTHVRCAAENADVQLGKLLDAVEALDAADHGETLVVLTADHGATYGQSFHGKTGAGDSNSNWYYAPVTVYDFGSPVPPETCVMSVCTPSIYNRPSPALDVLRATNNIQFSYQSTAIETWLIDHSVAKKKEGAAAMLRTPGVIASYWRDGGAFRLYGQNAMTKAESGWWKKHGLELVNTMAADNGPDIVGLLHDKTSYGVYGDHGGAQESVQEVPMVFWSPSLAFENTTGGPFHTTDVMPTILEVMGIPLTAPLDGRARSLD
jgi:arylsulfatase A-like enzyme